MSAITKVETDFKLYSLAPQVCIQVNTFQLALRKKEIRILLIIIILCLFYLNSNLQIFLLEVEEVKSRLSRKAPENKQTNKTPNLKNPQLNNPETNIITKHGMNLHDVILFASNYPLPVSKQLWEQKGWVTCRQFNSWFLRKGWRWIHAWLTVMQNKHEYWILLNRTNVLTTLHTQHSTAWSARTLN